MTQPNSVPAAKLESLAAKLESHGESAAIVGHGFVASAYRQCAAELRALLAESQEPAPQGEAGKRLNLKALTIDELNTLYRRILFELQLRICGSPVGCVTMAAEREGGA